MDTMTDEPNPAAPDIPPAGAGSLDAIVRALRAAVSSVEAAVARVTAGPAGTGSSTGVVAMAATDEGILYEGAFGTRELGKDAAMTPDTVVWIASMTKAITATAAMQLVERGTLQLDAPAADVVPALARAQVFEGFDASGTPQLRAPKRAITLKHLLTHTAGFSYEMFSADIAKYHEATGTPGILESLEDPRSLISYVDRAGLRRLRDEGKISGGMLPKAAAIERALSGGVPRVHVISYAQPDSLLLEVFTNEGTGTLVVNDTRALRPEEQAS